MQPAPGGGSSSGGGGEVSRGVGGLARFRSAPASWLEALLEEEGEEGEEGEEEEEEEPLKPKQSLTELLIASTSSCSSSGDRGLLEGSAGFLRQNSSPAELLIGNSDGGYLSHFGVPPNYEYLRSPNYVHVPPSGKRARELQSHHPSDGHPSLLKGEPSEQSQIPGGGGGVGSLIDMEMEKLFEDSVPCRVRAKRGCATHPRSIAERVRRTRISDRIRKLQELVPNMDKQTNTADMLEEAVEYVKFLQKQIQELSEHQRKCKCIVRD